MAGIFKSISPSDIRFTPFKVHKFWFQEFLSEWDDSAVWDDTKTWDNSDNGGNAFTLYKANYNPVSNYPQSDPLKDTFNQGVPFGESVEPTTANGKYQRVVHASIDHLYYKNSYTSNRVSLGGGNIATQQRYLEDQAYVLSMPQSKFGEYMLPGSIKAVVSWSLAVVSGSIYSTSSLTSSLSGTWTIVDDSKGNVHISGSDYYSPYGQYVGGAYTQYSQSVSKQTIGEWPFDPLYKYTDIGLFSLTSSYSKGWWSVDTIYKNVSVSFRTSSTYPAPSEMELLGATMHFTASASSSIKPLISKDNTLKLAYNFENSDFAISMMVMPTQKPSHPSGSVLLIKQSAVDEIRVDLNGNIHSAPKPNNYPYKLSYTSGSCKLMFERSNGVSTYALTSSVSMSLNTLYHVVASRSGSEMTLYVNSAVSSSKNTGTITIADIECRNQSDLIIGNTYSQDQGFNGVIDNLKMYTTNLTQTEVNILHHTLGVGNLHMGNCFYSHGMTVLTGIPIRYSTMQSMEAKGTVTLYENEVICTISPGEFNVSYNPSMQQYDPVQNQFVYRPFTTGSNFKPYVTTIGLYDDLGNLVMIGKLNTPLQLPNNMDTSIIVRYDR